MSHGADSVIESLLPVDVGLTLSRLRYGGRWDPCTQFKGAEAWRATRFVSGPATIRLRSVGATTVRVAAWGPGADEAVASAPALLGAADGDGDLMTSSAPVVRDLARRVRGLRIGRTGNPMEVIVPTIIHQKVQGKAAGASFRQMVRAARMRAPAPADPTAPRLLLPPPPEWLLEQPSWAWHRWGIEGKRATTIRTAAAHARHITEITTMDPRAAAARLRSLPGVGAWTVAEVGATALGDPDAVSVGDYWLCHAVCYALTGRARGTDEQMLDLLQPWSGQRGRVCRLIMAGGIGIPRFGPRLAMHDISRL